MNIKKLALLTMALVMVLSLAACGEKAVAPEGPFTNMDTVDLDGNQITSDIFADKKLTLVNVWNIGCTPCIQEIPALDRLNSEYADKGVAVLGLYYNFGQEISQEDRASINEILTNAEATYSHLDPSDAMMKTKELGRVSAFPTTFLVDSKGNIIDSTLGSREYEDWAKLVDKQLEKLDG